MEIYVKLWNLSRGESFLVRNLKKIDEETWEGEADEKIILKVKDLENNLTLVRYKNIDSKISEKEDHVIFLTFYAILLLLLAAAYINVIFCLIAPFLLIASAVYVNKCNRKVFFTNLWFFEKDIETNRNATIIKANPFPSIV